MASSTCALGDRANQAAPATEGMMSACRCGSPWPKTAQAAMRPSAASSLDPFRTDVAAVGGDDQVVLAPHDGEIAIAIEGAEIAGPPRSLRGAAILHSERP